MVIVKPHKLYVLLHFYGSLLCFYFDVSIHFQSLLGNSVWWGLLFRRNHSTDLQCKSSEWFLYDMGFYCQEYSSRLSFVGDCLLAVSKPSCYVIFRKGPCTTDLLIPYVDAGYYRSVEGGIGCFFLLILCQNFF